MYANKSVLVRVHVGEFIKNLCKFNECYEEFLFNLRQKKFVEKVSEMNFSMLNF
jgi:hypothetical protein